MAKYWGFSELNPGDSVSKILVLVWVPPKSTC